MSYVGWLLPPEERARLLSHYAPEYDDFIGHHVTLAFGDKHPLPTAGSGVVIGVANDGESVQALIVEIDGTTNRPTGGTYHITWSLDRSKGAKPVHSNRVIRETGWKVGQRVPIRLVPTLFP